MQRCLKLVDERNSFVAIAESGVQNQILSAIDRSCSQFLGPGAGIGMRIVRPGVRMSIAKFPNPGVRIAKAVGVNDDHIVFQLEPCCLRQPAFPSTGLPGEDDDLRVFQRCLGCEIGFGEHLLFKNSRVLQLRQP